MKRSFSVVALALILSWFVAGQANALSFLVDYTYDTLNFFDTQAKKDLLEDAVASVGDNMPDGLDAIVPVGPETWTISFTHPGTGGTQNVVDPSIAADTMVIYAGGRDLTTPTLAQAGPGGYSVSCFAGPGTLCDQIEYRGEVGETRGPTATESAWWGGAMTFDTNPDNPWHFGDLLSSPGAGENDFWSVAIHELGHVLGFGISGGAGSETPWENQIAGSDFIGTNAVAEYSGNVPLDAGLGHWENGTMSTEAGGGPAQEAALDPSIILGTRKLFTDLDYAGLEDLGWDVTIVPEPNTALLFGSGLIGLALRRKRNH